MRMTSDHESLEFWISDVMDLGSQDLGISGCRDLGPPGLVEPGLVGLALYCVSINMALITGALAGGYRT